MRYLALIVLFVCISSCEDNDDNFPCGGLPVAGLHVTVKDAVTAAVITDAVVVATDGDFDETLVLSENAYWGAYDRAANYALAVTKPGYITYTESMIAVNANECHAITTNMTVELQPE
jgi:hypothetical protein